MKWLGENPFHSLLLLTEKPGVWAPWQVIPIPIVLATLAGLLWAWACGTPSGGWAIALGLLVFAAVDGGLLAALPRHGISFGPAQPPFLALSLVRWLTALLAVPFAVQWMWPALAIWALLQIALEGLAIYGLLVEPFRLQTTRLQITSHKLSNPGTPLHILQLSDLHVERLTRRERELAALVAELQPDLIVLTGDFLSTSYNQDTHALADLRTLLARLNAPGGVYAIWGTAEVDRPEFLRPVLSELGIVVLDNQAIEVSTGEHRIWLMGVFCTRDLAADGALLAELMATAPADAFTVLLYHVPDLMPATRDLGVDLFLAGHTHGGQWRVPGFGALLTSSRFWKRYEGGHYRESGTHLYVSRGIGMEGFGTPRARLFCPPEVVSVMLTGTKEGQ
ncbi:MAG: metallophosphoesterase [Anaerolineae bacterium]|jgi:hypothetical protein